EQTFGRLICDRFDIRKISFTGSTEVGRWLYEKSSKTLKRLTLELGGNAPLIITESAVEEKFLRWLQYSKFRNCGQACTAVNRVLTHSKHFSTVLNYYRKIADDLTVGNGFDETSCIGPVISYALVKKIKSLIEDALKNGATIYPETINFESKFIPPIVLFNVSTNSRLFQEEIFGPVVPIYEAESDDQLLALANQTEYGLSCYLFCEDESKIEHFCENLDFEMIGINRGFVSLPEFPFGGRKASGFGKEGSGMFGIKEFLNFKNLVS
ncbi:MAG: aldehyde dehydrogenase family protein, partial [Deltaproteobacteria bacterium]|nr:aldehyde dehydrogenase family protein [Deltaproteobacteria bacterium]